MSRVKPVVFMEIDSVILIYMLPCLPLVLNSAQLPDSKTCFKIFHICKVDGWIIPQIYQQACSKLNQLILFFIQLLHYSFWLFISLKLNFMCRIIDYTGF